MSYRETIVEGYRRRLLNVLVADDLKNVFAEIGKPYPASDALQARYDLLKYWDFAVQRAVLHIVTSNIEA